MDNSNQAEPELCAAESVPPPTSATPEIITPPQSAEATPAAPAFSRQVQPAIWKTSLGHRLFTLAGFSFLLFEVVFLNFYFDSSWFAVDLSQWGIPTILILVVLAHFLLKGLQSDWACRRGSWIWKGKPPISYDKWLSVNESGITYGIKHVRWHAIDELELSWMGNLIVRSRAICGDAAQNSDIAVKIPYAAGEQARKNELIEIMRQGKPGVALNKRLEKSINSPIVKGQVILQLVSSAIMLVVLLDVGFSSFYYLELLKNYYLAGLSAMAANGDIYQVQVDEKSRAEMNPLVTAALARSKTENLKIAQERFDRAEYMTLHPFPASWVSSKFLHASNVAAGIHQERSHVLWLLGKREEAITEAYKALEEQKKNLRMQLRLVRLLDESGKHQEAFAELTKTIENHDHSLLPQLYGLALNREKFSATEFHSSYRQMLDECYANTFGIEPWWPPGGDRFFTELFYSRDVRFVFDRLLDANSHPSQRTPQAKERQR